MKNLTVFIDITLVGLFGINLIDLLSSLSGGDENLLTIDNAIKTLFSLAGLFYLIFVKIIVGIRSANINRKIRNEEFKMKQMENEVYKENHK